MSGATKKTVPLASDARSNQRIAANPVDSVWVNASAGSGKTTVLTERVTRLLLAGVRPEKILCLTYTRAGAAEMSNRITDKFSRWASCDDNTLSRELGDLQDIPPTPKQMTLARRLFAQVLSCPGGLRIRTIHSFCQEILRRFPIEAGLPPHFALIDEQDAEVLKREVLDDLLREAATDGASELAGALKVLAAEQGEGGFEQMLRDVVQMRGRLQTAMTRAGSEKALVGEMRRYLGLKPGDSALKSRHEAMTFSSELETTLRQMLSWPHEESAVHIKRCKVIETVLETPAGERIQHYEVYCRQFFTAKGEAFSSKSLGNKKLLDKHPELLMLVANEVARLQNLFERIEAAEIAEITESVLRFGNAFAERLSARKAARAAVDYEDLILFTNALLHRTGIAPWILYKLDYGIDHILVDEAQDTSAAQWEIVQALSDEFFAGHGARDNINRTLFVVGDEKQSIFSFQNADPEKFLSLRRDFAEKIANAGKVFRQIGLHTSFRSAPAVLRAVDEIFARDAARAGVSQEPVEHHASLNRDGSAKLGRVEVWPLIEPDKNEGNDEGWVIPTEYEAERDPQVELAQKIARKIKSWLTHGEALPGSSRPVAAGDIMILLRRRGNFAQLMVRALKAEKVPVTGVDRMHLIRQLPVMDLLAAVRFVLLPDDDLNLAELLRGPLLGLSEEQLMELAIGRKDGLWAALRDKAAKGGIFGSAHDYLAARLSEADYSTPFAFLSQLLGLPCPAHEISGRKAMWKRLGDESMDPIEELLNAAQRFGRVRAPSLQNFLLWLTQADTEIKREMDRSEQQVRIMTVHAAKGLEAPIVFLPDTGSAPRSQDIDKFQWAGDVPLFLSRKPKFNIAARQLWQSARDKQLEEYRRLFYVALTRAANRLYICGWKTRNEGDDDATWHGLAQLGLKQAHDEHLRDASAEAEIVIADAPLNTKKIEKKIEEKIKKTSLPVWAFEKAPTSVNSVPPIPPPTNFPAATPDAAFARGRIIHRLLQYLPEISNEKRDTSAARFLSHPRFHLTAHEQKHIRDEVGRLLDDERFRAFFGSQSRAEVPLAGRIGGVEAYRQVDRLCLHTDEVWVLDYKTNRPPPKDERDVPQPYRQQLNEYRSLLRGIYTDKKVRTFLLWTYTAELMEIHS